MALLFSNVKCSVCGEPATTIARDCRIVSRPEDAWEQIEPVSLLKAGCDKHPVQSKLLRE